jgi:hypothetical protein
MPFERKSSRTVRAFVYAQALSVITLRTLIPCSV